MKVNLVLLALLSALLSYASAGPICMGYKEFAELDTDCRARMDEPSCMQGYALRSQNISVSCIWHQLADTKTIDRQILYNRGGSVIASGVNYQGSICSTTMRMTLPSSAKGRWGSYMRLLSGPQNVSLNVDSTSPRESFVTAGCTLGKGAANSCKLTNTAPKGKALTPSFKENAAVIEFFTTDKDLIKQYNDTKRLSYNSTLKFKLEFEGTRCRDTEPYPKETPALLDQVVFGPTSYMLNETPKRYFLRTYRAYRVSNVTGIDWSVDVLKSMEKSGNKTRLTSFLMREQDYFTWADKCITNCTPPEDLALPHTICKGLACTGKIRALGAANGAYRLLVSYPEISSFISKSSFSNTEEVETRFKKELVKVEIWPKAWAFNPVVLDLQDAQEEVAADEQAIGEESVVAFAPDPAPEPALAPAPGPGRAPSPSGAGVARIYMPDESEADDAPLFKPPVILSSTIQA
jgi:hypothetical protein